MQRRLLPILASFSLAAAAPAASDGKSVTIGTWKAPDGLVQIPIWPGPAPDSDPALPPESVLTAQTPEAIGRTTSQAIFNVSVPTVTIYPPKGKAPARRLLSCPGAGSTRWW